MIMPNISDNDVNA